MDKNELKMEEIAYNKNYTFYISEDEYKTLEKIHSRYKGILDKQKESFGAMVRYILIATYTYLSNLEIDFDNDLLKILSKKQYEGIDSSVKSYLSSNTGINLLKDLVRTQVLKTYSQRSIRSAEDNTVKVQFRLTDSDIALLKMIMGNNVFSTPDYLSSLIKYFLNSDYREIIYYYHSLPLFDSINQKRYVLINNRKYKVIEIKNRPNARTREFLCFNKDTNRVSVKHLVGMLTHLPIQPLYESFSLSPLEERIIEQYSKMDKITIKFKLLITEDELKEKGRMEYITSSILFADEHNSFSVYSRTKEDWLEILTMRYSSYLYEKFISFEEKNYISNLVFSDNVLKLEELINKYESGKIE